jgi:crotonobetainyl-CoA:carnitine CoA-transferase CaiB-like acyl-CoA transferase
VSGAGQDGRSVGSPPLTGIVVVDLGRIIAGPFCSFLLAALGATVVRVDRPRGDISWRTPPFIGPGGSVSVSGRTAEEISLSHVKRGRGKRSVVLDYSAEDGRLVLRRLIDRADVVVENFRPAVLEDLGLDFATLSERNPRLVYCAISGYGLSGPHRDWPSMDLAIQAASGFMARTGFPDGPPVKAGSTIGDQVPAVYAALGVVAALRQRDRTGRGQLVDVAMNDVMTSLMWDEPIDWLDRQGLGERWGNADPRGGPLNAYRAEDGWVALVVGSDTHWAALCRLMGREDILDEVRTLADRHRHHAHLDELVAQWCATRSAVELGEELRAVGIPGAKVMSPLAALEDPQVVHRGTLRPLTHPASPATESGFVGTALPVHFGAHDPALEPSETLGASTHEVLADMLGMDGEELDQLAAKGVIGAPP